MKKILLISGDGIGSEIMEQAEKVLHTLPVKFQLEKALLGGAAVDATGNPYPPETQAKAHTADAILLAAVGGYKWDSYPREQRPESGLLAIRKDLRLFANLRPVKVFNKLSSCSSLKPELIEDLNLLFVRELTGGIYFGQPRGIREENGERVGFNTEIYSESEIRRVAKVAFETAKKRNKRVCSVDKMNVLESSQLWREVMIDVANNYPDVELTHMLVDNMAMQLVRNPKQFDVILTSNIFGDILSDEASMLTGSIGMLPSASLREDGVGLYEPIHGSAPDIAGKNIANPYAMILSVAMMLRYSLNEEKLADLVENAVQECISEGILPADLSEKGAKTNEIGNAVAKKLQIHL